MLTLDDMEKMMKEVLEQEGLKDIQDMEETITAYSMDFGGDPELECVLPNLLAGLALHLVFFNASLGLNNPIHIKVYPQKENADSSIEYRIAYTQRERLFEIISRLFFLSKTLLSVTLQYAKVQPRLHPQLMSMALVLT